MGKSGFKRIVIDVSDVKEIEFLINFARSKARGLAIKVEYQHGKGLELQVRGPRDRVSQYEYELRTAFDNMNNDSEEKITHSNTDTIDDEDE